MESMEKSLTLNKDNCPYINKICGNGAQCILCEDNNSDKDSIIHLIKIHKNHDWEKTLNGEVDLYTWVDEGAYGFYLHGPRCKRCGATFAANALDKDSVEKELIEEWDCVIEEKLCPWCYHKLDMVSADWTNCPYCGHHIDVNHWEEFEIREEAYD